MATALGGMKVAILAADGVEQMELEAPSEAIRHGGGDAHIVSISARPIRAFHQTDPRDEFAVDRIVRDINAAEYQALIIPGGPASINTLRADADVVQLVRVCAASDKLIAAIGDGPGLLIEADLVKGRTLTSIPTLRPDIRAAGGTWIDAPTHVDQRLLTSRTVDDLRAFCAKLIDLLVATALNALVDEASSESFPASDAPAWGPTTIGKSGKGEAGKGEAGKGKR